MLLRLSTTAWLLAALVGTVSADERTLLTAAKKGNLAQVEQLLAGAIDLDVTDRRGRTALLLAVQGNHVAVVDKLVTAGASLHKKDKRGTTALSLAQRLASKKKSRTPSDAPQFEMLELLEFNDAVERNAVQPLEDFIATYPASPYLERAKQRLEHARVVARIRDEARENR